MNLFDMKYTYILKHVLSMESYRNVRTGKNVKAVPTVYLEIYKDSFPALTLRDIKPLWSFAEAVWFTSGSSNLDFMHKFKFNTWDKFSDPDGKVRSATGYRWRHMFGIDQLANVVMALDQDRSTRRAVLNNWSPYVDLAHAGKNVPCIVSVHLHILNEALHMSVFQRSADLFFGFPHDILGMRIIQELVAARLEVRIGTLGYFISNAHLYEDQWDAASEMITRGMALNVDHTEIFNLNLKKEHYYRAFAGDSTLVTELYDYFKKWYKPLAEIKGPRIVV